ncbi:TonB-dependent receptor [Pleionea sp. CnH1-48]|uniref:TonB-dependent receptor n=1 Tax=Pleionea sp. CnH1-48 TaxID=2954494 RepID=UPI002096D3A1|nr:TonB-dependent receptor [Pleionea sp. CnH1-48]MCO7226855.1 TonB-dependent receptor [Pleionea sp. CnH1-48]
MIQLKRTTSCVLLALSLSPLMLQAEDEEEFSGDISLEDLLNLKVTSASKIATKISEAPAVITAYTQEQLDEYGFDVINDLLYSLPGFGPSQDYDRPTVATRGNFDSWSNNHILHLVDGVPLNDNLYGTAYTWLMPTFTTKVMEVIRGPGSALYGSNATNGVVQMNTFKAADLEDKIYSKVTLFGTEQTRRHEFMTGAVSDDIDFIMAYSFHITEGNEYLTYDGSNRMATLNDPQTGRPRSQLFMNRDRKDDSYFWAKLSVGDEWQFQYHRQTWDFDTGHGWVFWVPDFDEEMNEYRDIFSIKYNNNISENLSQEYVLRYQKHHITWNQRYYPDDAFAGFYPSGMWEYLDTEAADIFVRAQFTYLFGDDSNATLLGGFEGDRFLYKDDHEHYSNIDVDVTFAPFPGDINQPLGPWLDYIAQEPVINTALYGQLTTGNWISEDFEMTFGIRWDKLSVDYKEVYTAGQPQRSKDYSRVSPRVAGVWSISEDLVFKGLWGKAFRAPTPTEMGGAHTFSLASNIEGLEPELITTLEFVLDWTIDPNHVFRANYFQTEFENQIAYSTVNLNLSTNIYSTENSGFEFELLGNYGDWNWFSNLSFVQRDDERILAFDANNNPEFTSHPDDLKWEPGVKINAGISYKHDKFDISTYFHYHGEVERRANELGNPNGFLPLGVDVPANYNLDDHRPTTIDAWITFNAKAVYKVNDMVDINLDVRNLFEEEARLLKTGPFPFDYQIQGRQIFLSVVANM